MVAWALVSAGGCPEAVAKQALARALGIDSENIPAPLMPPLGENSLEWLKARSAEINCCISGCDSFGFPPRHVVAAARDANCDLVLAAPGTPSHGVRISPDGSLFGAPAEDFGPHRETLDALLGRAAKRHKPRIAVKTANGSLSYGALEAEAEALAEYLAARGIGPGDRVAICASRSLGQIIALRAVLATGAAFLPLDAAYPLERLAYCLADASPSLLLFAGNEAAAQKARSLASGQCAAIDVDGDEWRQEEGKPVAEKGSPDSPAYVIYTSGSTGRPKGVELSQAGAVNLVAAQREVFDLSANDRVLQFAAFGFDAAVFEILMALTSGATLVLSRSDQPLVGEELVQFLAEESITHATLPPAALTGLSGADNLPALRVLVLAGEAPSPAVVANWGAAAHRRVFNAYGPSEATVWSSAAWCDPVAASRDQSVSLGFPIPGVELRVLDPLTLEACAPGQPGELFIGGAGVGLGYIGRPDLTAEKFVTLQSGSRYYRSGDMAVADGTGALVFRGRVDHQVKLRGHRIELPEVEHALIEAGARNAAAFVDGDRLLALVEGDASALGGKLAAKLPASMVPDQILSTDVMPLTSNGKIDRKALVQIAREGAGRDLQGQDLPVGGAEQKIARIWSELLGRATVGRHDNFFALGGHSLTFVRYQIRHREVFGQACPAKAFHDNPTVAGCAELLQSGARAAYSEELTAAPPSDEPVPLTAQQRGVWLIETMSPSLLAYNAQAVIRIHGRLDADTLQAALDALIARHEIFRTTFELAPDGLPQQFIHPDGRAQLDRISLPGADRETLFRQIEQEVAKPFALGQLPLVRWCLFELAPDEHALLHIEHHLVHDGWSANLILSEILDCYDRLKGHDAAPLVPPPAQYRDYAKWQQSSAVQERFSAGLNWWVNTLEGAPLAPPLDPDFPRPPRQDFRGRQLRFSLKSELVREIDAMAVSAGVSRYAALLASFAAHIGARSGRDDLLIGSASANRRSLASETMPGMFVNSVALRLKPARDMAFADFMRHAQTTVAEAQEYEDIPFEQVVRVLEPERTSAHNPLFQIGFSYHNSDLPELKRADFEVGIEAAISNRSAKFDLELVLIPEPGGSVTVVWTYATSLFSEDRMTELWHGWHSLIKNCCREPGQSLSAVSDLSENQRRQILQDWNVTQLPEHPLRPVHEQFADLAKRRPDAIAIVTDGETLTYQEVERRANLLAGGLLCAGVGAESLVALYCDRDAQAVISMLAVLKAGGSYLPLDPDQPAGRTLDILHEAAPHIVLCPPRYRDRLAGAGSLFLWEGETQAEAPAPPRVPLSSRAYVIFTSGSTGRPKGVEIEHAQLAHLLDATRDEFGFAPEDIWSCAHSLAFDFSVWEIWGALTSGGRVVMAATSTVRDPMQFWELLRQQHVTILNQTPAAFVALAEAQPAGASGQHSLRQVIFGGDRLEPAALAGWAGGGARNAGVRLTNMYGITETCVHVTLHDVTPPDIAAPRSASPIGRPLRHLRLYILDEQGRPVAPGAAGEIHVGGFGVARGYLGRRDLTQARFIDSPFVPGDRLYRTGDKGRFRADGTVEFLGRDDHQLSLRGYRIEPGEIEARLLEAGASQALVLAREGQLLAYVDTACEGDALQVALAENLPAYMQPAAIVRLDQFPLTANGKVDRARLRDPEPGDYLGDGAAAQASVFEAPRPGIESRIAQIWQEVLGCGPVGRHDNFFALGGHSLLAIRVIGVMRARGIQISAGDFFSRPVLASLAAKAEQAAAPMPAAADQVAPLPDLTEDERDWLLRHVPGGEDNLADFYPLSPFQEGALFHHMMSADFDPYIVWRAFSFTDRHALDRWFAGLRQVVQRHDIMRTGIVWEGLKDPLQYVVRSLAVDHEEVASPPELTDADLMDWMRAELNLDKARFDLRKAPLFKVYVTRNGPDGWLAIKQFHHVIDDNTSLKHLDHELAEIVSGRGDALPAPVPFKPFALEMRRKFDSGATRTHFAKLLKGIDAPTVAFGLDALDHGRELKVEGRAAIQIEGSDFAALRDAAAGAGVTIATLMHAAMGLVLAEGSGDQRVIFGTVLSGRMQGGADIERAVGPFINTLPVVLSASSGTLAGFVRNAADVLSGLIPHEHATLSAIQRVSEISSPLPLFAALLNHRNREPMAGGGTGARIIDGARELGGHEHANFPLTISSDEGRDTLRISVAASRADAADNVSQLMKSVLKAISQALKETPGMLLADLRARLRPEAKAGTKPVMRPEKLLHEMVRAAGKPDDIVCLSPDAPPVSRRQLLDQADRIASALLARGFQRGFCIGLSMDRGADYAAAALGVLQAGGAFLPLDPSYPEQRLADVVADACPCAILVDRPGVWNADGTGVPVLATGDLDSWPSALAAGKPLRTPGAPAGLRQDTKGDRPAYVLYTSGSSGRPKGVVVPHGALASLLDWAQAYFGIGGRDRMLFATSIGFDISIHEVFLPLVTGGTIIAAPARLNGDAAGLSALVAQEQVTVMQAVPTMLRLLIEFGPQHLGGLRMVFCGGEMMPPDLAAAWVQRFPDVALFNMYGPTEATIWATAHRVAAADTSETHVPVGKTVSGLEAVILGADGARLGPDIAGELCLHGAGLSLGYLHQEDQTRAAFQQHPQLGPIYHTGDRAVLRGDGSLVCLGRKDHQIKLNGHRIEPAEIEARLVEMGVHSAVAMVRGGRLVAYVTGPNAPDDLRASLSRQLPVWMVPSAIVALDDMPLTASGKIDRAALPEPESEAAAYVAPEGEVEATLAEIWAEVLAPGKYGRTDDFFACGGDSLSAVRLNAVIAELLGETLPLKLVYQYPQLHEYADMLMRTKLSETASNDEAAQ